MRIAVVGAGAIGTYLAHRLHRAGHDVTIVARHEYIADLAEHGLHVRVGERMMCDHVHVVDRVSTPADLVLLAVKSQDLAATCEALRSTARGITAVTLQNGVQADAIAASILGPETLVGGVAMCAITCLRPGVASVEVPGWFILDGKAPEVARVLRSAVPTFLTPNLRSTRWTKLIANLTNGLSAATGFSLAELARSRLGRLLAIRVMREGHRVARAAGIQLDHRVYGWQVRDARVRLLTLLQGVVGSLLPILPEHVSSTILSLAGRTSLGRTDFRGSTWQSLVRGKSTEIDYLNGEIVRLGARLGLDTPYNARIVDAVHAAERSRRCFTFRELCPSAR